MFTVLLVFYVLVLTFSLLHLAASAIITTKRIKAGREDSARRKLKQNPKVSIFKPLKGLDDRLEENLRSFFELDYSNFELIFGLGAKDDPAFDVVGKLILEYTDVDAKIVVSDFEIGLNPKINNLFNMESRSDGEYILISDSNTRVRPDFLRKMVPAILEVHTGIVTATIRGMGAGKIAAVMENLHINSYISPNVFVADAISGIPVVIGKSILISRNLLQKMGGFAAFKNYLAEDYLLGLRARELGYKVKTIPTLVDNVNVNWSLKRFLNRHTRWAKIRRHMRLHHYIIESFSNPVALSVILTFILHNAWGMEQLAVVTLLKILHDRYVSGLLHSDLRWYQYLLGPLKDLLIGLLWIVPFFSYKVSWRDNYFCIGRSSQLHLQAS